MTLVAPTPGAAETRSNRTFDALLWALSRPGQIRQLPDAGEGPIVDALIDMECRVFSAVPELWPLIDRTGAERAALEAADHVFLGSPETAEAFGRVTIGSDLYPDDGATVILRAHFSAGRALRLTGPGVDGHLDVVVGGLPDGALDVRAERLRYPMGFDMILVDGDRIMGLPRSTKIEVI